MPPIRVHAKPKKGTIKRLMKSLWKNFKFGLIISFITLVFSILTNLSGSVFASLITEVLTKAIQEGRDAFNDIFDVRLLNMIPLKANLTILIIGLASIMDMDPHYGGGLSKISQLIPYRDVWSYAETSNQIF